MVNKKYVLTLFILLFSIVLKGMNLSEVEGIEKLSNYDEIKNIPIILLFLFLIAAPVNGSVSPFT